MRRQAVGLCGFIPAERLQRKSFAPQQRSQRRIVFDVAARIGGGTNIHLGLGHPYGNALWREPMSTGRRLAREIRLALDDGRLGEIVT